jgi:hypothetical protein
MWTWQRSGRKEWRAMTAMAAQDMAQQAVVDTALMKPWPANMRGIPSVSDDIPVFVDYPDDLPRQRRGR